MEEIQAVDWNGIEHDELIGLCKNWNGEKELFRRIIQRSLQLVFLDTAELAVEIGEDTAAVELWLEGKEYPSDPWTVLILSDIIQVRLQTYKRRIATQA